MAIVVANTDVTNTFDYWRNRTNELAFAMSTKVMTTDTGPNVGNTAVLGNMQANTVTVGFNAANQITIVAPTTAEIASGYFLSANGQWASAEGGNKSGTIPDVNPVIVDSWSVSSVAAAEYKMHLKATNSNNYTFSKISLLHDNGNAYTTEYAMVISNNQVATVSANINAGIVRLYVSPLSSGVYYKLSRSVL